MRSQYEKVLKIARETRGIAEILYRDKTLGGECMNLSNYLFQRCHRLIPNCKLELAWCCGHAFCLYENKIIDITATQFLRTKPVTVKDVRRTRRWFWNPKYSIGTPKDYSWAIHELGEDWPSESRYRFISFARNVLRSEKRGKHIPIRLKNKINKWLSHK